MQTICELLRRTRLERGIDLAAIAEKTKIDAKFLRAIETGDITSFPGRFFYKSFVHQYATFLGMNTRAIDAEVDRALGAEAPLPLPGIPKESAEKLPFRFQPPARFLLYATFLVVLVASIAGDAWWHEERTSKQVSHASIPRVSAGSTAAAPDAAVARQEDPQVSGTSRFELALKATEDTWLSISSDGTPVFSGILEANQTKTIEGKETANLRVGNAAGLEVRLNGAPLGSLGAHGQVRILAFTPDKFHFVSQPN